MASKRKNCDKSNDPVKKRCVFNSSFQKAIVNMFQTLKAEAEEENVCLSKVAHMTRIAGLLGHGFCAIQKVIRTFEKGEPFVTPGKHKKRPRSVTGIDDFSKEAIGRFIYDRLNRGERVTAMLVLQHMRENYETYLYNGSLSSLRIILKEMGFKWTKENGLMYVRETAEIQFKRSCFLREYVRNMESERPKPVVFLDETWIFMNGSATYSWNKPAIVHGKVQGVMRRPAEGGRLVILHAGTKDGFVPGADLIFASNLKTGQDYHGAMNSEKFQKWLEKQLLVGLRNLGPCMIIMDNASYHNKVLEQQPTSKWRKDQLMTWLRQNGVSVPDNANKNELHQLCKMNRSNLKRYVSDEILAKEGHTVLRLPPYHSFFNAIELVWSVTKNYYNKSVASWLGHGLDRARAVWKEALSQVSAEMWRNEVIHTEKLIMKYYNEEVRNAPEVEEFVIDLRESDEDSQEEDVEEEELATPLEPAAGTSGLN